MVTFKNVFAKEKTPDTLFVVSKGPIRSYVHINAPKLQKWLLIGTIEKLQLIILVVAAIAVRVYHIGDLKRMIIIENDLLQAINGYISGQYFSQYNPPLVPILYSIVSRFFGYSSLNLEYFNTDAYYSSFPIDVFRYLSAIINALTVLLCYKTLRSTGVSHLASMFGSSLLAIENSMITYSRVLSTETLFIFFMMLFLTQHKLAALKTAMGKSWIFNTFMASLSLGLAISTHWTGLFLFTYSVVSLGLELYYVSGDIRKPLKISVTNFVIKMMSYIILTTAIYFAIFNIHFQSLQIAGNNNSYNQLSPDFQFSLKNNHIENTLLNVGFESSVMLRHYKSGKYLHSHADYFNGGHQQVTLLDNYDDTNNLFQILPSRELKNNAIIDHKSPVTRPFKIELLHKETNSTLVIDPNSKPPISEQEYNMQVTTDKNFDLLEEEDKSRRYQFELRISNKYSRTQQAETNLHSVDSVFQIYNEKNGCYLLGTPLELHEGFSEGQYEIICIKEPNFEASLWYIDWNINEGFTGDNTTVSLPHFSSLEKFVEVHLKLVKSLFLKSGYDAQTQSNDIKALALMETGSVLFVDTAKKNVIYFLGNVVTYYLVILAIIAFALAKLYFLISFDPHVTLIKVNDRDCTYSGQTLDYVVGHLLLLLPMKFVNMELHGFDYLPSLMLGILVVSQSFQWLCEKWFKLAVIIMVVTGAIAFLAFYRFTPLIYALPWTQEECTKLMVSPKWDGWVCGVYQ